MLSNISEINLRTTLDIVPNSMLDLNCDIYFINRTTENLLESNFEMLELYSIKNNVTNLQSVEVSCRDLMHAILIKATRRTNFFQIPIIAVVQVCCVIALLSFNPNVI